MGFINVNDLKPGMILDQPVINKHGTLLMDAGSKLAEKHITIFKTWGVTEAGIKGVDRDQLDAQEINSLPAHVLESIEKDLKTYFADFRHNKVMKEIYRITRKFRINEALSQGARGGDGKDRD